MDNYVLENVHVFDAEKYPNGVFLIAHRLHRTPYHLGLISNNTYFSLTVNGPEIKPINEIVKQLGDTTYNNLIVQVQCDPTDIDPTPFFTQGNLDATQFKSCLFPIRDWLSTALANNKIKEANNLFELLDILKANKFITELSATRMTPVMEGKIVLERYTAETIRKHIKRLQEIAQREQTKSNTEE